MSSLKEKRELTIQLATPANKDWGDLLYGSYGNIMYGWCSGPTTAELLDVVASSVLFTTSLLGHLINCFTLAPSCALQVKEEDQMRHLFTGVSGISVLCYHFRAMAVVLVVSGYLVLSEKPELLLLSICIWSVISWAITH